MLRKSSLIPNGHRRMRFTLVAFALFLLSLGASGLFAQTDTGNIAGTVTDATGAVIPGANVLATNTDNGLKLSAVSNGTGEFTILAVPRGNYSVTASAKGFQSQSASITVVVTSTQTVTFQLSAAGASTTVEVTGATPLVDTSDATIGATIEGKQVTDLPLNGRNFTQLALLTPGVTRGAYGDVASGGGSSNMTETMRNNESGDAGTLGQRPSSPGGQLHSGRRGQQRRPGEHDSVLPQHRRHAGVQGQYQRSSGRIRPRGRRHRRQLHQERAPTSITVRPSGFTATEASIPTRITGSTALRLTPAGGFLRNQPGFSSRRADLQEQAVRLRRLPGAARDSRCLSHYLTVPTALMRTGDFTELARCRQIPVGNGFETQYPRCYPGTDPATGTLAGETSPGLIYDPTTCAQPG